MWSYLFVFLAVAIVDVFWTQYFLATKYYKVIPAGVYSSLIILFGAFTTRAFVHDGWLVIPAAFGAFVGTAVTIMYNKPKVINAPE
jgi:hypothetical protein